MLSLQSFLREGRVVGPCWEKLKPQGHTAETAPARHMCIISYSRTARMAQSGIPKEPTGVGFRSDSCLRERIGSIRFLVEGKGRICLRERIGSTSRLPGPVSLFRPWTYWIGSVHRSDSLQTCPSFLSFTLSAHIFGEHSLELIGDMDRSKQTDTGSRKGTNNYRKRPHLAVTYSRFRSVRVE